MNKQTAALVMLLIVAVMQCGFAQTTHQLPFASTGNSIELTVANTAKAPLVGVKVTATDVPVWLRFAETVRHFPLLKPEQEVAATFMFTVDKNAPVRKNHTLKFLVTGPGGEQWEKEITVTVAPPDGFEVYQNFPNPFNPTTAISFQLPAVSRVNLRIYNMLGQEVALLVDEDRAAGYHRESWNAAGHASGMYVYQITATDETGTKQVARKTMLLLK